MVLSNRVREKKVFFVKPKPESRPGDKKKASEGELRESWFKATMEANRSEARAMLGIEEDEANEEAPEASVPESNTGRFERFSDVWKLSEQAHYSLTIR